MTSYDDMKFCCDISREEKIILNKCNRVIGHASVKIKYMLLKLKVSDDNTNNVILNLQHSSIHSHVH